MPETYDVGPRNFVTSMRYLPGGSPPLLERGATTRETEDPFRIGRGIALRIPLTRQAVIFGRWLDDGGDEDERLRDALRAHDTEDTTEEISEWAS